MAKSASGGVLRIDDGNLHRDVQLDGAQVANGAILYKPNTDDVNFRLQVQGQNGNVLAENLRLLDGTGHAVPATDIGGTKERVEDSRKRQPPPLPVKSETPSSSQDAKPASPRPDLVAGNGTPKQNSSSPVSPPAEPSHASGEATSTTPPQNTTSNPPTVATPTEIPTTSLVGNAEPQHAAQAGASKQQAPNPVRSQSTPTPTLSFAQRYLPPKPIRQVLPNISELPNSMLLNANRVTIIVEVDQNGRVTSAQPQASTEKVARPVIQAAQMAAKQWIFQPAQLDGKPVVSEHSIVFQFGR